MYVGTCRCWRVCPELKKNNDVLKLIPCAFYIGLKFQFSGRVTRISAFSAAVESYELDLPLIRHWNDQLVGGRCFATHFTQRHCGKVSSKGYSRQIGFAISCGRASRPTVQLSLASAASLVSGDWKPNHRLGSFEFDIFNGLNSCFFVILYFKTLFFRGTVYNTNWTMCVN